MAYVYTPPTMQVTGVITGTRGLTYGWDKSSTVWKDQDGVWHNQFTATSEDLSAAQMFFRCEAFVSDETAAELAAFGLGTLVHISSDQAGDAA